MATEFCNEISRQTVATVTNKNEILNEILTRITNILNYGILYDILVQFYWSNKR